MKVAHPVSVAWPGIASLGAVLRTRNNVLFHSFLVSYEKTNDFLFVQIKNFNGFFFNTSSAKSRWLLSSRHPNLFSLFSSSINHLSSFNLCPTKPEKDNFYTSARPTILSIMDFDPYRSTGTAASANMRAADPFAGFPTSAKQPETVQQGISDPFAQFSINAPPVAPAQSTAQLPMQPQVTPYSLGTPQQSSVPVPSMPSVSSFDPLAQNTAPNAPSFPAASVGTVPFDPFASADPNASTTHSAPSVPPEQAFDPFAAVSASATGDGHAAFGGTPVAAAAPPPAAANDSLWDIPDMAPPRKSTEPAEASSSAIADPRLQATYGNGESAATASSAAPATTSAAQSRPPGAVRDDPLLRKSSSSTEASSATPPMGSILARVSTRSLLTQDWKRLWFSFVPPSEDDRTG